MKNQHHWKYTSNNDYDDFIEKKKKRNRDCEDLYEREDKPHRRVIIDTQDFKCRQCGAMVSANRELSGVNNRNHCPVCLWSRHVDLLIAGDRKADCGSRMEPIGLSIKEVNKRYNAENQGELMLVHRCTGCGKISINRIAADDDTQYVFQLYLNSCDSPVDLRNSLISQGIHLLNARDFTVVYTRLFGKSSFVDKPDAIFHLNWKPFTIEQVEQELQNRLEESESLVK